MCGNKVSKFIMILTVCSDVREDQSIFKKRSNVFFVVPLIRLNSFKKQYMTIPYPVLSDMTTYSASFWIKDFSQGAIFS